MAGHVRGRRGYGDRGLIAVRPPAEQMREYEARARDLGIPLGSWVVMCLAEQEGLPVPEYIEDELAKAAARRSADATQRELDIDAGGERPLARSA